MRCKIGYWRTGLAVTLDEEAYNVLVRTGRGLVATLQADRRIVLMGGRGTGRADGHISRFGASTENVRAKKASGFFADASVKLDMGHVGPGFQLPLFESHEVDVDYSYVHDALLTDPLVADHLLPWPVYRAGGTRMSAEELRQQCFLRCRSHMLSGGHGYFDEVGVPAEIVRMMAGGYVIARDKARAEVDSVQRAA